MKITYIWLMLLAKSREVVGDGTPEQYSGDSDTL